MTDLSKTSLKHSSKATLGSYFILAIGLLATIIVTIYVHNKNQKEDSIRMDYESNLLVRRIQSRMETYEGALTQMRAFILNSKDLHHGQLQSYIRDTEIFSRSPGLQGIGYVRMVSREHLKVFTEEYQKLIPGFRVWPDTKRDIYSAIVLLEPLDKRNQKALGFDMFYEPTRNRAMELARDINEAVMSELVILVQEDRGTTFPGFNLYLPHYKHGSDLSTIENRRNSLIGFIYSPFRAKELFDAIFGKIPMVLDVEIYDGQMESPGKLYYDSSKNEDEDYYITKDIVINQAHLLLKFSPLPQFPRAYSPIKTFLVFLTGLLMSLAVFWLFLLGRRQMTLARIVAAEKSRLLEKEKQHVAARDEFLSIASHELKTPLTSLKLQAQVMMRAIKKKDPEAMSEERVFHLAKLIDSQTSRLTRLVDDMLDISRIRSGSLRITPEDCDLNDVAVDVIERLKPQIEKATGKLPEVSLSNGLQGKWDRFRLEQVLTNLVTNALRYGEGKPVSIRTYEKNSEACLEVKDHGVGIAKENLSKIFERFERAGMSANEISGLGLGLYITNQIVVAHRGKIHVESEPNEGSTFTVVLPMGDREHRHNHHA